MPAEMRPCAPQPPLGCQRSRFEIPDGITWLNAAYMSPLSQAASAAGQRGIERRARPWELPPPEFFREVELARAEFASLIQARADDIAIVPAVSYGIEIAARNLPLHRGHRVVVLADQFPSNVHTWQWRCEMEGAKLVRVPWTDDCDWTTGVLAAIDQRTQVVALPACHWTDGTKIDLKRISSRCRELQVALVLDVTQSLGVCPLDVREIQPDFLVCASYKWLLGPYSLGYLYAAPHRQAGIPIEQSPWARIGVDRLLDWRSGDMPYPEKLMPNARRYDVGERANFGLVPISIAALSEINAWQPARISAYLEPLVERAAMRAQGMGLGVPPRTARSSHMIGITLPQTLTASELSSRLRAQGIHVGIRGGKLRVSPHVYNEQGDIDRLFEALGEAL